MSNNNKVAIRTLYVSPIESQITRRIKPYFEQFGEVENVRFHSKDDFKYGFVQFKMAECASAVLAQNWHYIANRKVKVKAGDLWHQPDFLQVPSNPLLVAPDQNSTSHILNSLNDDCLREIFRYFNLMDLSSTARVCVRFNQQAKEAFGKKYKDLNLTMNFSPIPYNRIKNHEAENILKNFGQAIRSLRIDSMVIESAQSFLRMVSNYCSKLKDLEISGFALKGNLKKIRSLFSQLEKLQLIQCECNHGFNSVLTTSTELKVLQFEDCDFGEGTFIEQKFPKLEEVSFNRNYNFEQSSLRNFIKQNSTLKKLKITFNGAIDTKESIKLIGQNLPNLLELELDDLDDDNWSESIQTLGQLRALKVLKVDFNMESITSLVKTLAVSKVPIEHLKLVNGDIDNEAIECICKIKQIKVLEFIEMVGELTDDNLFLLAKELTNLEEFHLSEPVTDQITTIGLKKMLPHAKSLSLLSLEFVDGITIDVDDYKAMIKIIQSRRNKVNLLIKITGSGGKVNIPEKIVNENREILYIDETIEDPTDDDYTYSDDESWLSDWSNEYSDDDFFDHYSDADSEDQYGFHFVNGQVFYF
ncbi:uncharacterized protein LOC116349903 [Contarinia nasturtii]|uniref:uncharacterized protein LOC116349903 n=1 Tax=Contarinia nasturtii TaxID=265458 RepID=UPI0012D4A691|nr:uncharacterized protein LOC116349903 [Contarinia nasturtii]XP_031637408.1 uncharacterized protein LOC116349903 [Contarinia nasturtii]